MAEDLQGLLNRIQADGLQKAEDEKSRILSKAEEDAKKIVADAKAQAESIVKDAQKNAETSETKAQAAIKQAARDIMIALRCELETRLQNVAKSCVGTAMDPKMMGDILLEMTRAYAKNASGAMNIEVLLAKKDLDAMESLLKAGLLAGLKANPTLSLGHDFSAGFKVGFSGDDVFLDFSDEALSEIICEFVGPKLGAVIKG